MCPSALLEKRPTTWSAWGVCLSHREKRLAGFNASLGRPCSHFEKDEENGTCGEDFPTTSATAKLL